MARSLAADDPRLYAYLLASQPPQHAELRGLRERTAALPNARLQIAPEQGPLLAFLVRLIAARDVLEIGTFTGYSALVLALALPRDGKVVTCDVNGEWPEIGRSYWERADAAGKIDVRVGPARETLAQLKRDGRAFDLIFIDANKEDYDYYYEDSLALAKPGGLIVLDNMLQRGAVAVPEDCGSRTVAIRRINAKIAVDDRVDHVMLAVGDGMTLVRPR